MRLLLVISVVGFFILSFRLGYVEQQRDHYFKTLLDCINNKPFVIKFDKVEVGAICARAIESGTIDVGE